MPELTVHTLKRAITIRHGNDASFQYLASSPFVPTTLTPARIEIEKDGKLLSASWHGLAPCFLSRTASARDLVLQLDSEIAELSLRDAEPHAILSSTLLNWRGRRLLLLGAGISRTALALTLFPREVDIEGDWACRLSAAGATALPRSVRWDARLLRAFPQIREVTGNFPIHCVDSFHGELSAWCPQTGTRPWLCPDGPVDGIVVTEDNTGGCSLARRIAPDFTWGHLMAARVAGDGGVKVMSALKSLAASAPALKLAVGDLAGAAQTIMEFLSSLKGGSSPSASVAQQKKV